LFGFWKSKYGFRNILLDTHIPVIHAERFFTLAHIVLYRLAPTIIKKILFTQILTLNPCMIQKLFFFYLCTCNYKNNNVCYNNTYTVILESVFRRQINLYVLILNCWKASIMGGIWMIIQLMPYFRLLVYKINFHFLESSRISMGQGFRI
jgi:hypothetical protein